MNLPLNLSNFTTIKNKNIYLIFFLPVSLLMGSLIINLNILLIISLFLVDCYKDKNFFFLKEKNFYFLIFFNFYLILNSLLTAIDTDSLVRAISFFRFIVLAYAIYYYLNINNKEYEKVIFKVWTFIFIIVTVDLIFEYIFGYNTLKFKSAYYGRLSGFTGDELKIGGFYFAFILIPLIFIKKINNKAYYIFFIIFLVTSLLIGERSNYIKIVFISIIFFLIVDNILTYKKVISLFVLVILTSFLIYSNDIIKNRFIDSVINNFTIEFSPKKNKHFCHYNTAIEIFKNNPFMGIGLKKYRLESWKDKYAHPIDNGKWFQCGSTHPHQIHFELLSELGIIGYFLFISYFIFFLFKCFKKFKKNNDEYSLGSILFIFASILPLIPSGSLFTTYTATLFWINYSIALRNLHK
tara:strand:- start:152 stop:1378 length:1227 start_codon:yes stop_codon:yes gene_type:complete